MAGAVEKVNESGATQLNISLELDHMTFQIHSKLGRGNTGTVFLVSKVNKDEEEDLKNFGEEENVFALKYQKPSNLWEYYVSYELSKRVPSHLLSSIAVPKSIHVYQDESYLLTEYCSQGTLTELVKLYRDNKKQMDELLLAFYSFELMRIIYGLHEADLLHCDVHPDNIMIRSEEIDPSDWSPKFQVDGSQGWSSKGFKIIDFGKSLDLTLLEGDRTGFRVQNFDTDILDLLKTLRGNQPWLHEIDYIGICFTIYFLLSNNSNISAKNGNFAQIEKLKIRKNPQTGRWEPSTILATHLKSDIWNVLFDTLLNATSPSQGPQGKKEKSVLIKLLQRFAGYLLESAHKPPKTLKNLLDRKSVV